MKHHQIIKDDIIFTMLADDEGNVVSLDVSITKYNHDNLLQAALMLTAVVEEGVKRRQRESE